VLDMNQSENVVLAGGGGLLFAAKVLARAQQPAFRNGLARSAKASLTIAYRWAEHHSDWALRPFYGGSIQQAFTANGAR
jgi:hypothetical protein